MSEEERGRVKLYCVSSAISVSHFIFFWWGLPIFFILFLSSFSHSLFPGFPHKQFPGQKRRRRNKGLLLSSSREKWFKTVEFRMGILSLAYFTGLLCFSPFPVVIGLTSPLSLFFYPYLARTDDDSCGGPFSLLFSLKFSSLIFPIAYLAQKPFFSQGPTLKAGLQPKLRFV